MRVSQELVLDAGTYEDIQGEAGPERVIHPPETTLFHQLLAYLREKPDPPKCRPGALAGREGVAAAALVLRWGSYLGVLLGHDKPEWSEMDSADTSRISDAEMARINIEASAALADWIDIFRADATRMAYEQLVSRAIAYLPMPRNTATPKVTAFAALAEPEMAARLIGAMPELHLEKVRAEVVGHPSRIFANALTNTAWRNGPVENIHAGKYRGYPLDHRRMALTEERKLMSFASERLALGMMVCRQFAEEQSRRPWTDQVLPYGLAELLSITPSGWTLTETSREVRLKI
jgi:hypothetical protein